METAKHLNDYVERSLCPLKTDSTLRIEEYSSKPLIHAIENTIPDRITECCSEIRFPTFELIDCVEHCSLIQQPLKVISDPISECCLVFCAPVTETLDVIKHHTLLGEPIQSLVVNVIHRHSFEPVVNSTVYEALHQYPMKQDSISYDTVVPVETVQRDHTRMLFGLAVFRKKQTSNVRSFERLRLTPTPNLFRIRKSFAWRLHFLSWITNRTTCEYVNICPVNEFGLFICLRRNCKMCAALICIQMISHANPRYHRVYLLAVTDGDTPPRTRKLLLIISLKNSGFTPTIRIAIAVINCFLLLLICYISGRILVGSVDSIELCVKIRPCAFVSCVSFVLNHVIVDVDYACTFGNPPLVCLGHMCMFMLV